MGVVTVWSLVLAAMAVAAVGVPIDAPSSLCPAGGIILNARNYANESLHCLDMSTGTVSFLFNFSVVDPASSSPDADRDNDIQYLFSNMLALPDGEIYFGAGVMNPVKLDSDAFSTPLRWNALNGTATAGGPPPKVKALGRYPGLDDFVFGSQKFVASANYWVPPNSSAYEHPIFAWDAPYTGNGRLVRDDFKLVGGTGISASLVDDKNQYHVFFETKGIILPMMQHAIVSLEGQGAPVQQCEASGISGVVPGAAFDATGSNIWLVRESGMFHKYKYEVVSVTANGCDVTKLSELALPDKTVHMPAVEGIKQVTFDAASNTVAAVFTTSPDTSGDASSSPNHSNLQAIVFDVHSGSIKSQAPIPDVLCMECEINPFLSGFTLLAKDLVPVT